MVDLAMNGEAHSLARDESILSSSLACCVENLKSRYFLPYCYKAM